MSGHSPIDIVQMLARQRGRGEQSPLLLLRPLEARPGARISHLPISQRLSHAWVTITGAPFRPHQSLALSALRRGEPFALMGGGAAARQTMHLLLHEELRSDPQTRALLVLPDEALVEPHLAEMRRLNGALGTALPVAHVRGGAFDRGATAARVLLATPDVLHGHLLRHHDRAWQSFWRHLRLIMLFDIEAYSGVAAKHLAGLLMRSSRLTAPTAPLLLAATLAEVDDAAAVLAGISGQPWRILPVDDAPSPATTLAVWQLGTDRLREIVALALACQREGYSVHITCNRVEAPLLQPLMGTSESNISLGIVPRKAQVQIIVGYPGAYTTLHHALTSGAQLTLLLLGTLPAERTLARLIARGEVKSPLLDDPPPAWALPAANAYVAALHLLCAATERPLSAAEVAATQAGEMVARLERNQQLVRLPDDEGLWQPLPSVGDPYAGFGLRATGTPPTYLYDDHGALLTTFDPSAFDRWGFVGAAFPPGYSNYRVAARDEETGSLTLKAEHQERRTFPLRRCTVSVRDEREQRALRNCTVGWGRVLVDEEIYGYRESRAENAPAERVVTPALTTRWTAPAVWIDLPITLAINGQFVGWSLAAALPLRVLCDQIDLVPAYDADQRRIYFIDAHPGGNGLSTWVYTQLESLLPLAYDIALDCRSDTLLEPLARADMDWLLTLLGSGEPGKTRKERETAREAPPAATYPPSPAVPAAPQASRRPDPGSEPPLETPGKRSEPAEDQQPLPLPSLRDPEPSPVNQAQPPAPERAFAANEPEQPPTRQRSRPGAPRERGKARTRGPEKADDRPTEQPDAAREPEPADSKSRDGQRSKAPRSSRAKRQPLPSNAPAPPPERELTAPDADAMIARMRRLREQREAAAQAAHPDPAPAQPADSDLQSEPRFNVGDQIFCLPYGYGVVHASAIEKGQEILRVEFPDYGELTIEPSVSLVRRIEHSASDEDDVL